MFKNWVVNEEARKESIVKIDIFDFDDTLVYTPNDEKGQEILTRYNIQAQMKGKPEITLDNDFYWYSAASLEPPIVPNPTPCIMLNQKVAHEFYDSARDPKRLTVVLTGRPKHLKLQVKRILDDFKLKPNRLYLVPADNKTLDNKIKKIAELLDEFDHVEEIEMWEDRGATKAKLTGDPKENHVKEFKKFLSICRDKRNFKNESWKLKFKVNEIPPRDDEAVQYLIRKNAETKATN